MITKFYHVNLYLSYIKEFPSYIYLLKSTIEALEKDVKGGMKYVQR